MGTITKIQAMARNKKRADIYVDGERVISLATITVAENFLCEGKEIDQRRLDELALESDTDEAFARAARLIARRARTKNEIIRYLSGKGYSNAVLYHVIEKLTEYGYINDSELVNTYIDEYSDRRGKRRMQEELKRMGADEELINVAIGQLGDQRSAVRAAAEKYLKSRVFDYNKTAAHLAMKGFEWEDISQVLRELREDE